MKPDKTLLELWASKEMEEWDNKRWNEEFIDHFIFGRNYTITKDDSYTRIEQLTIDEVIENFSWVLTEEQIKILKDAGDNTPQI